MKTKLLNRARALLAVIGVAAGTGTAEACEFRQQFFTSAGEGMMAHVRNARTASAARRLYSGWCAVQNGAVVRGGGERIYFAFNNRSDTPGAPRYYLVKIYRRSRASELNPLFYLRRSGAWQNSTCPSGARVDPLEHTALGREAIRQFILFLSEPHPRSAASCNYYQRWLGYAHGLPTMSLGDQTAFLRDLPPRVRQSGVEKWSFNVLAAAYRTTGFSNRLGRFPVLLVTRDGADELIVQVTNGNSSRTFSIAD